MGRQLRKCVGVPEEQPSWPSSCSTWERPRGSGVRPSRRARWRRAKPCSHRSSEVRSSCARGGSPRESGCRWASRVTTPAWPWASALPQATWLSASLGCGPPFTKGSASPCPSTTPFLRPSCSGSRSPTTRWTWSWDTTRPRSGSSDVRPPIRGSTSFPAASGSPTGERRCDRMAAGHDFHRCALVEPSYAAAVPSKLASGTAQILSFAPERVVVRTDTEGEALVVLAEAWYPGWQARASGGEPLPTLPVNAWMRGAVVPAGRHEVVFTYRSRLLWPGALLSLAVLVPLTLAARTRPPHADEGGPRPPAFREWSGLAYCAPSSVESRCPVGGFTLTLSFARLLRLSFLLSSFLPARGGHVHGSAARGTRLGGLLGGRLHRHLRGTRAELVGSGGCCNGSTGRSTSWLATRPRSSTTCPRSASRSRSRAAPRSACSSSSRSSGGRGRFGSSSRSTRTSACSPASPDSASATRWPGATASRWPSPRRSARLPDPAAGGRCATARAR